jgi:hypothetical protein
MSGTVFPLKLYACMACVETTLLSYMEFVMVVVYTVFKLATVVLRKQEVLFLDPDL